MAAFALTAPQQAAVDARGSSILVSAAAGSGKTRVLVERLLSYVTDAENPEDIDRFLIITYTRAAAAELRSRILEELDVRVAAEPQNKRLRRQSALCQRARIGTIHSFCTGILREKAHKINLPADFRVADEDRAQAIKQNVLEKLLEKSYENINSDPDFCLLVDTVGAGRDDRRLEEVILELHTKMQSHPWPADWVRRQQKIMELEGVEDISETPWGAELLEAAQRTALYWSGEFDRLLADIYRPENEKMAKAYGPSFSETADALRGFTRACANGWDAAAAFLPIPFPRLGALRGFEDEALLGRVKSRRDACNKAMKKLAEDLSGNSTELIRELALSAPAMRALLELTLEFDAAFSKEKLRLSLLDFSDLEHYAAKLLIEHDSGNPTETAIELSRGIREIMVDEYQDVNAVQDMIFRAISDEGKNLFMVGDVKQSIYRFRLADPTIFIKKYLEYQDIDPKQPVSTDGVPRRILLQQNFRSRACVLDAANHVFSNTMSRELGEIDYDDAARLVLGASYPEQGGRQAQLCVIEPPAAGEDEDSPDKTECEAISAAQKILELVNSDATVSDAGVQRPVGFGDIVILMRSPNKPAPIWRRVLGEYGIPVMSDQSGDFFTSLEISVMTALLTVIDNPHQDVPVISVLRSPFFGFSADTLSEIRSRDKASDFFTALTIAAEEDEKCREFLSLLDELRTAAPDMSVNALLWHILDKLDVFAICSAMADGAARVERLFLLLELAQSFESSGYRGLSRFVEQLHRMIDRGDAPPPPGGDTGGSVRIMSIHKSKGLEFPYVLLADTSRQFNKQDATKTVLIHSELGLGARYTDLERGVEYPTAARRAIARRIVAEGLSEELRVLYVAMTRAKEGLFITAVMKNAVKAVEKLIPAAESPISPQTLSGVRSFAHWLILCSLLPDSPIIMELSLDGDAPWEKTWGEQATRAADPEQSADEELVEEISSKLEFKYPRTAELPSKLTATELKSRLEDGQHDDEAQSLVPQMGGELRRPDFAGARIDAMSRGTATHLVMQHIHFEKTGALEEIEGEISRLIAAGRLSEEQAQAVDSHSIFEFFASPVGKRLLTSEEVYREFRFSLLVPAKMYYPDSPESEEILLQGVVDCCFVENGRLTIIDFKTDRVTPDQAQIRAELYRAQIDAYQYAMERILLKPVEASVLYFLSCGKIISYNE